MFINATTDVGTVSTKVFASKRAIKIGDSWIPIDELLDVVKEQDGYRVILKTNPALGISGGWLSIGPDKVADSNILKKAMRSEYMDSWHFGPRLRVASLGDDILTFKILKSAGVSLSPDSDSLFFDEIPELGLSLQRWTDLFGEDLTKDIGNGTVILDLASIKDRRMDLVSGSERLPEDIDLDPETVIADLLEAFSYKAEEVGAGSDSWSTVRDASLGEVTFELRIQYAFITACTLVNSRFALYFDVVGLPLASSAFIHVCANASPYSNLRLVYGDLPCLGAQDVYGEILVAALAGNVVDGDWSVLAGNWSKSPDIMASGGWRGDGKYSVLNNSKDLLNGMERGLSFIAVFDSIGGNAAYLELLYPTQGGSSGTGTDSSTCI